MKLTAITVSVNYSDFLYWGIKYNKKIFDRWIVVTDKKDTKTAELCLENNIECIQTNVFYEEKGIFRKYAGINEALKLVPKDSYVVFIDGDIVLSPLSRRVLNSIPLDKNKIYGIDRVNCKGFNKWIEYQKKEGVLHDNWLLHGAGLEFGARIIQIYGEQGENGKFRGYTPLGFFQMCHRSSFDTYPEGSISASHGDLAFAKLWKREDRVLIPEILGIHLDTGEYKSMNWEGRKSSVFDYKKDVPCLVKTWNKIIIFLRNICLPSYGPESCFCKIFNWIKKLFK